MFFGRIFFSSEERRNPSEAFLPSEGNQARISSEGPSEEASEGIFFRRPSEEKNIRPMYQATPVLKKFREGRHFWGSFFAPPQAVPYGSGE